MTPGPTERRRVKVSVTVEPELLKAVDSFVGSHPGLDRSKVFDEALYEWYGRRQEEAMAAQFTAPASPAERDERQIWRQIRSTAAARRFQAR